MRIRFEHCFISYIWKFKQAWLRGQALGAVLVTGKEKKTSQITV